MAKLETRTGYKPDHIDFGKFILSEQARQPAIEAAEDIRALAAVRVEKRSGKTAESYKVNSKPEPVTIAGNPRVGADVYSDEQSALAQEFGNARTRNPSRPLGKAGAQIGEVKGKPG